LLAIVITWAFGLPTANAQTFDLSDATALTPVNVKVAAAEYKGVALALRAADFERRLQSLPGVTSTAIVTAPPFGVSAGGTRIMVAGYTPAPNDPFFTASNLVGIGFFRAAGIRIVRGRDFAATDANTPSRVAIVNEAFARTFFHARDPIGLKFTMSRVDYTVVGVAQDARTRISASPCRLSPISWSIRMPGGFEGWP
jgi:hypothetical protein